MVKLEILMFLHFLFSFFCSFSIPHHEFREIKSYNRCSKSSVPALLTSLCRKKENSFQKTLYKSKVHTIFSTYHFTGANKAKIKEEKNPKKTR